MFWAAVGKVAAAYVLGKFFGKDKPEIQETQTRQPTLDDFRQPTCEYGVPIVKVFGTGLVNGQMLTNSAVEVIEVVNPTNGVYGAGTMPSGGGYAGNTASGTFNNATGLPNTAAQMFNEAMGYNGDTQFAYAGSQEFYRLVGQGYIPVAMISPVPESMRKEIPYSPASPAGLGMGWG